VNNRRRFYTGRIMKKEKNHWLIRVFSFMVLMLLFLCNEKDPEKPNIIFVLTEDHRWDALGVMGNPIIQTPNIDGLAREGLMFQNAYA
jgi:hypothetical protein